MGMYRMTAYLGEKTFYIGAWLLCPLVFFSLGLFGPGEDYLTYLSGNLAISKAILGTLSMASTMLMVDGYKKSRDGKVICWDEDCYGYEPSDHSMLFPSRNTRGSGEGVNEETVANKIKNKESFHCFALVEPQSAIASTWSLTKPSYCMLEYCNASGTVEIRWGDGSRQQINEATKSDELTLSEQFDDVIIIALFY
ncbi:MAG: hypothetical protein CMF12_13660 [Idiomarina sp.]|uniref:hypothetical protein n=1 Tax=Idiomarina sp. TaxID=1874361 RepID=UPI000C3A4654|nr:hypothetical protein [Idiomarina sp.]MBT43553.1 hypothetical protein [Idiomarina sp.]